LLQATSPTDGLERTPLEIEGSRFLTQQAHSARLIISVRELATGAARDVSGVLRVTRSSRAGILDEDAADSDVGEMEALYLVSRDGGVKVFQRGTEAV
jgi:elongator complex protein 6